MMCSWWHRTNKILFNRHDSLCWFKLISYVAQDECCFKIALNSYINAGQTQQELQKVLVRHYVGR